MKKPWGSIKFLDTLNESQENFYLIVNGFNCVPYKLENMFQNPFLSYLLKLRSLDLMLGMYLFLVSSLGDFFKYHIQIILNFTDQIWFE